jgi:hypothetical protein
VYVLQQPFHMVVETGMGSSSGTKAGRRLLRAGLFLDMVDVCVIAASGGVEVREK